jgi:hypothetical protein
MNSAADEDCVIEVGGLRTTVRLRLHKLGLSDLAQLTRAIAAWTHDPDHAADADPGRYRGAQDFRKGIVAWPGSAARSSRSIPSVARYSCFEIDGDGD